MKRTTIDFIITSIVLAGFLGALVWQNTTQYSGLSGQSKVPSPPDNWTVIKVSDGDTLVVRQTNGREMKVRLCAIDSPEKDQVLGLQAKNHLQSLVDEADRIVMVSVVDTDKYGRSIAEVFTSVNGQEKSLNEEQLSSGMAFLYQKYYKNCFNSEVFVRAEAIARQKSLGVWSQPNMEKPWDYRRRVKNK